MAGDGDSPVLTTEKYLLENLPDWYSPGWGDGILEQILFADDEKLFIKYLENKLQDFCSVPQRVLDFLVHHHQEPIKCLEALITGQTPLTVDLNLPCRDTGIYAIHYAAMDDFPNVELLLYYGARTDIPFPPGLCYENYDYQEYANMLPLQIALSRFREERSCHKKPTPERKPSRAVYKFLISSLLPICFPSAQYSLEKITLLAWKTKDTDKLFLEYAMKGDILEFASLLIVAHKKVYGIMDRVLQHFDSVEQTINNSSTPKDMGKRVVFMRQLIEVFDRAGDEISKYFKQDKRNVSNLKSVEDFLCLVQRNGFSLPPLESDDDLSNYLYFLGHDPYHVNISVQRRRRTVDDFGMPHYSKTGYRWKVSNKDPALKYLHYQAYIDKLRSEISGLKEENVNILRKQRQLKLCTSMDDELGKALQEDNKDKFHCVIDGNLEFFRTRQQQLLYAVCESGSIKCAEALIKGETSLTVDLNLPCTDTGLYPLHCAALWSFPSMTELFLYYGAFTDVYATLQNLPQQELVARDNKLPFHMALLGISSFPCIREWTSNQSIINLVTLFCLPRMQNPLETLGLLANTTKGMSDEFTQFAMDGKFVELAALLIVAHRDTRPILLDKITELGSCSEISNDRRDKLMELAKVFKIGNMIAGFIEDDKYNVSRDQLCEKLRVFLNHFKKYIGDLHPSDTDLSIYQWYRDEESSYPTKAPFEDVRLLHDIGMEHFRKLPYRWDIPSGMHRADAPEIQDEMKNLERELQCLKEENAIAREKEKQDLVQAYGSPLVFRHGVPVVSLDLFSTDIVYDTLASKPRSKMEPISTSNEMYNVHMFMAKVSMVMKRTKPKTRLTLGCVGGVYNYKQGRGGNGFGLYVSGCRPCPFVNPNPGFIISGLSYKRLQF